MKVLLGLGLFITVATGLAHEYRRPLYRRYLQLRLDESSEKGTLSQDEFQVIRALLEVVSPKPAPSTEEFLEFVNWRTLTAKGYYTEYRRAVALLESKALAHFGVNFHTLDEDSREEILRKVLPKYTLLPLQETLPAQEVEPNLVGKIRAAFELLFFSAESRFKYFIFWDLLRFYWLSSSGWAAVGYRSHPGVPDPQRTYTSALGRHPTHHP